MRVQLFLMWWGMISLFMNTFNVNITQYINTFSVPSVLVTVVKLPPLVQRIAVLVQHRLQSFLLGSKGEVFLFLR